MGLKPVHRRSPAAPQDAPEDQTVRQYRYLLRTAPGDALEAAHVDALSAIGPALRETVLRTVQTELVAGAHLHADNVVPLAHLVTLGERRRPGVIAATLPQPALSALAREVIHSEPAFGLFGGYAAWDGLDPQPPQEHDDSEYGERWHASVHPNDGNAPG
jgi:hypothetical protein